jgi:hypothetical protein
MAVARLDPGEALDDPLRVRPYGHRSPEPRGRVAVAQHRHRAVHVMNVAGALREKPPLQIQEILGPAGQELPPGAGAVAGRELFEGPRRVALGVHRQRVDEHVAAEPAGEQALHAGQGLGRPVEGLGGDRHAVQDHRPAHQQIVVEERPETLVGDHGMVGEVAGVRSLGGPLAVVPGQDDSGQGNSRQSYGARDHLSSTLHGRSSSAATRRPPVPGSPA